MPTKTPTVKSYPVLFSQLKKVFVQSLQRIALLAALFACITASCVFAGEERGFAAAENTPAANPQDWDSLHSDEAVVALAIETTETVRRDATATEHYHYVLRIQNEAGTDIGEFPLGYNSRYQRIKDIRAFITTPEGKKRRYKMIQDVDTASEGDYSDFRKKIITFPEVVPGSIMDISYTVENRGFAFGREYFASWDLYHAAPVKYCLKSVTFPEGMPVYFRYHNTDTPVTATRAKGTITYSWETHGDEGYDKELGVEHPALPAIDFLPSVDFSTIKDWQSFCRLYWQKFAPTVVVTDEMKAEASRITASAKTDKEKVEALCRYIFDNVRYVEVALDEHEFVPHAADEVFKNKFGDCKDQTVLLTALLRSLGITANPVLVRSEDLGDFEKMAASPFCFDHMIAAVTLEGATCFVDPLLEGYRPGEIPVLLARSYALIVGEKGGWPLKLPQANVKDRISLHASRAVIHPDGSATMETVITLDREDSIDMRRRIRVSTEQSKQEFMDYLENATDGGSIGDYSVEGGDDPYGLMTISIRYELPHFTKPRGRIMIFDNTAKDFTGRFYWKERTYPLWLPSVYIEEERLSYVIPPGFSADYLPQDTRIKNGWFEFSVDYEHHGSMINRTMRRHFKPSLVSPQDYPRFKQALSEASKNFDECIIIKKRSFDVGEFLREQLVEPVQKLWGRVVALAPFVR